MRRDIVHWVETLGCDCQGSNKGSTDGKSRTLRRKQNNPRGGLRRGSFGRFLPILEIDHVRCRIGHTS